MKWGIRIPLILIPAMLLTTDNVRAQNKEDGVTYNSHSTLNPFSLFTEKSYFSETSINDININAVSDFTRSFSNIRDQKWYTISDGFIASFTQKGVQTKVVYDLRGQRHCVLSAFNEIQMPVKVKEIVKSRYRDFNILVAYEIKYDSSTVYIMEIETKTQIKILKMTNGEIEVTAHYTKG